MPPLPSVAKVVRVDFHFSQTGNANAQVREFFQYAGTLSQTDAATWCSAIRAAWGTNMMAVIANSVILNQTVLTDLSSNTSPQVLDGTIVAGSVVNPSLANGVALVVRKKIARRYRGGHPRMYIMGIDNSALANSDTFASTSLTNYTTKYNAFVSAALAGVPAAAGPATHVNVSYFQGFVNKTFPSGRTHPVSTLRGAPVVDPIIGISMNPVPASQRRRNQNP